MLWTTVLVAVLGYLIGSVPFGWLLSRAAGLGDIRAIGSGNIGATNVLRTGRRDIAALTLLLDAAKGAVAVLAAGWLAGPIFALFGGVMAVVGHCTSVWMRGRGGKGVATGLAVIGAIAWPVGLLCCAVWLGAARLTRQSSPAALAAFAVAPILMLAWREWPAGVAALAVAALVFARHAENIRRLLAGTEPRIGAGK